VIRRIEKTETRQVRTEVVESISCDICGREQSHPSDNRWDAHGYHYKETTIELEDGSCYPGEIDFVRTHFDICPTCFIEKLAPWIKSFKNADPSTTHVEA
jgi:hypothetical protein